MKKNELKEIELAKIEAAAKNCQNCELSKTRSSVVFSDGSPSAKIILIGEAPGQNEDLSGLPFVGRAGKLLDEFLSKAEISRKNDVYIINTIKCRPPNNRPPKPSEKQACRHFLEAQIEIVSPSLILLCGATALKSFHNGKETISKLRGEFLKIQIASKTFNAMPIFHPSYLLRNHSVEENSPRDLMLKDLIKAKSSV